MQEEKPESTFNVIEITQKMEKMDELLKKDFFSNPLREVQENMRNELLEFRNIFNQNLGDLENYIALLEQNQITIKQVATPGTIEEEEMVPKRLLEKKEYQCEILKKSFGDYEKKMLPELEKLNAENTKLNYRIGILLQTIERLEKGQK